MHRSNGCRIKIKPNSAKSPKACSLTSTVKNNLKKNDLDTQNLDEERGHKSLACFHE